MSKIHFSKIDAKKLSNSTPDHIESVILELINLLNLNKSLAEEVLYLNSECLEIGAGKLAQLKELASNIIWEK